MKALSKVASALSFAHLAGIGKRARAEADEDDDDKDVGERDHEDGNVKKGKKAKGDDDKDYAEDDSDDEQASDDDLPDSDDGDEDDDGDKKGKKAKKAKAEDEDAEDDEDKEDRDVEMRGNSPLAKARRREQARCAAIFASKAAAGNPALAANLAFKTRMSRKEALAVLESTPAASAPGAGRASRNPNVGTGASGSPTSQQAISANWDNAFKKAGGRR